MKRATHILILIATLAITFSACSHNNGDIGIWFGTWHVEKITHVHNGEPVATYKGRHFMQFQNNIIRVTTNDSLHNYEQSFGTWEADEANHLLRINFPDSAQFECTLTGINRQNTFFIEEADASHITFSHANLPDSLTLRYYLKKLD